MAYVCLYKSLCVSAAQTYSLSPSLIERKAYINVMNCLRWEYDSLSIDESIGWGAYRTKVVETENNTKAKCITNCFWCCWTVQNCKKLQELRHTNTHTAVRVIAALIDLFFSFRNNNNNDDFAISFSSLNRSHSEDSLKPLILLPFVRSIKAAIAMYSRHHFNVKQKRIEFI